MIGFRGLTVQFIHLCLDLLDLRREMDSSIRQHGVVEDLDVFESTQGCTGQFEASGGVQTWQIRTRGRTPVDQGLLQMDEMLLQVEQLVGESLDHGLEFDCPLDNLSR
ncbi:hypothetical protein CDL60_10280 [Roseateles noduli]|nr:hypothetical protein CDL60_10280 [Roseateles noduli]